MEILFWISGILIFWGMIGYPVSLLILEKALNEKKNLKLDNYIPYVTLLIVAHNEQKVIKEKLKNAIQLSYPKEKLEIIVSSDNSDDLTNSIVKDFIKSNPQDNIKLFEVKDRKGKTNAQNEAVRTCNGEILVMTDANAMLDKLAIKELTSSFSDDNIAYVSGQLIYVNDENWTSRAENTYWNLDIRMREIESNIQTITAGNGAIYACRLKEYYDFEPIKCHDSSMPLHFALNKKRAIYNKDAKAYEKSGETHEDEFKRKVRMSRDILTGIFPSLKILNIFKYKWFTYFYLGHRTSRYLLSTMHILLYISTIAIYSTNIFYALMFLGQTGFYLCALLKLMLKIDNKLLNMTFYYCLTLVAQLNGMYNQLTGKAKPIWEKAESTR